MHGLVDRVFEARPQARQLHFGVVAHLGDCADFDIQNDGAFVAVIHEIELMKQGRKGGRHAATAVLTLRMSRCMAEMIVAGQQITA